MCSDKHTSYYNLACTYDIETSTVENTNRTINDKKNQYTGFMYLWQFCIEDCVVMGRTWEEFLELLDRLHETFHLSDEVHLVIYVHFLAFEFQFTRNFLNVESVFARKKRVPMKVIANNGFEFRCSYFLSNMSLDKFIKNTPNAIFNKQSGEDFDYSKLRLPNTPLTEEEKAYGYCDVRGLAEAIKYLLKTDTIASLPLTSTGFLRRDVRKAVLANPQNKENVKRNRLTPMLYVLCKTASRGGNTHANADYSDILLTDMASKDRKSSYPAEMLVDRYPVTPFKLRKPSRENFDTCVETMACLIDVTLYNVALKPTAVMPYLALAKLTHVTDPVCDNGRIARAKEASFVCTDIDFKIIANQYTFDSDIEIRSIYTSEYGKLNNEFRNLLLEYFEEKTKLENGDPYLYAKFKNKINAFFGMMLTDICSPEIMYDESTVDCWAKGKINVEEMLDKYYNKRTSFLSYQHGIWVTANARKRLQDALDQVGHDSIYTDTDSVKYIGDHEEDFRIVNEGWLADCDNNDIRPYVDVNGKRTYLGVWEDDGRYDYFKTLGAKKYAFIKHGSNELHITVAGLNKKKGAEYLEQNGGINAFTIGTTVPKGKSGRTTSYYNDVIEPHTITINGYTFTTASNIAVVEASYTFGMSDDYLDYLFNLETDLDNEYQEQVEQRRINYERSIKNNK